MRKNKIKIKIESAFTKCRRLQESEESLTYHCHVSTRLGPRLPCPIGSLKSFQGGPWLFTILVSGFCF